MAVLTIGGDDAITTLQLRNDAHCYGLLSVIEMQEAANLLLGVQLCAAILKLADTQHLGEQCQRLLPRRQCSLTRLWKRLRR